MTQEEKQLLLKDLSARLTYCVKVNFSNEECILANIGSDGSIYLLKNDKRAIYATNIQYIKPYLRPMSSMTDEEFEKLKEYGGLIYDQLDLASFQDGTYKCLDFYLSEVPSYVVILVFDWLNAHHFDYRGLIEKGLALKEPKGMYEEKTSQD